MFRLILLLRNSAVAFSFISVHSSTNYENYHYCTSSSDARSCDEETIILPAGITCDVRSAAEDLWGGPESLGAVLLSKDRLNEERGAIVCHQCNQGEMPLPPTIPLSRRFSYYEQQAHKGDPRAQHSVGLLLWNGFTSPTEQTQIDSEASARWHAAAAVQGNLDAIAVFGGCLRTGKGVGKCKNIALGLRCIEYSASTGNPSGVNKKGALMEANDDYFNAMKLYRECYEDKSKRTNALLLFNLGYCLIHGDGVDQNTEEGEKLWRDTVALAPEEGSEEAAWFLYQQYLDRDNVKEAEHYLDIAADLGLEDALIEKRDNS